MDEAPGGVEMLPLLLSVLGVIILLFFLFIFFVAYKLVTPSRLIGHWNPGDFGAEYEGMELITEDDVKLKGWYIKGDERCVILVHGYSRSRWDDVYMRPMMEMLWKNGFSILAFDLRAHGESGGKHTTLGDKEFLDLKAAFNFCRKKCRNIYIVGYSMGGFLALKAAASGMGDKIIADSPFIRVDKSGARGLKYFANLPPWLYFFVGPIAAKIANINIKNLDPFSFANKLRVPVLIIAGNNDPLVKLSEIEEFIRISGRNIELWTTSAAHVRSIQVNPKNYLKRILGFLEG